jgi:hypothetical protein
MVKVEQRAECNMCRGGCHTPRHALGGQRDKRKRAAVVRLQRRQEKRGETRESLLHVQEEEEECRGKALALRVQEKEGERRALVLQMQM